MPGLEMMPKDDHEAAMARADLYKLANYSFKLFKMIQDGDQLEGWVQAKVTKAADYIASVYHYMEYEMKFSEYGEKLETSDMYTEEIRQQFKAKLMEAQSKLEKLSKKNQEELAEAKFEKSGVRATDKKKGKVDKSERKQYFVKLEKEGKTRGVTMVADEGESEGDLRDRAKRENMGWTIASIRVKDTVDEAAKPDYLDFDKDGNKKEPMKKALKDKTKKIKEMSPPDGATAAPPKGKDGKYPVVTSGPHKGKRWSPQTPGPTMPVKEVTSIYPSRNETDPAKKAANAAVKPGTTNPAMPSRNKSSKEECNHTGAGTNCPIHGMKECGSMYEASKPSAGMTKKEKSAVVKKAKAGGDIGKPGKGFAKVEKAAKAGGAKNPKAVAAAAMWKSQAKK